MKITYQAESYKPELIKNRYVRKSAIDNIYYFCEVGEDRRFDLRQGIVEAHELPKDVKAAADEASYSYPSYVKWEIES